MSEMCRLQLYDPEANTTIEILVSQEEAERAKTDLEFATRLLSRAGYVEACASPISSPLPSPGASTSEALDTSSCDETSAGNSFKWPHEGILLLIEEYKQQQANLTSGKISQKRVWGSIAKVLQVHGHRAITGSQCLTKFNGMKRTYKSIKDHNERSGNNPRVWPYLDLMDEVLGEKPFMQPVATLSSTGAATGRSISQPDMSEENVENSQPTTPSSTTRKRKATSEIAEAILESRRMAEERKDQRQREKLEKKKASEERILKGLAEIFQNFKK